MPLANSAAAMNFKPVNSAPTEARTKGAAYKEQTAVSSQAPMEHKPSETHQGTTSEQDGNGDDLEWDSTEPAIITGR